MQATTPMATSLREKIMLGFLYLAIISVFATIGLELFFTYLQTTGQTERVQALYNEIDHKIDGQFKNNPGNIWYDAADHIYVESVTNEVIVGKLAGNRNLEFGVKNVLEEYLQEKGYDLSPDAENKLRVEIVYLDMLTTKKSISIVHRDNAEVVIRLKGMLYKDGIKVKEITVEESSSEISMSTLIVDGGGKFNQTSLSNALKKGCDKLVTKLLGEK